jgi:leucyl/phenylalanyl-tRNA--protein transferase
LFIKRGGLAIFWLDESLVFPSHEFANEDGILALGGDLSVERLLLAYSHGIFPWYNEGEPIIWWSLPVRFVLYLNEFKIDRTLKKFLKKNPYRVTFDQDFSRVIQNCKEIRSETGTWITEDMKKAYVKLYQEGYAHSVEVWQDQELVGGLYGVSFGKYFCGESMFTRKNNASKIALIFLSQRLQELGFQFIDCQVETPHLVRMGAKNIPREDFLALLKAAISS